ncbi:sarcosine oxidase subunit alpha [Granulicella aggregans]|uniref:Sarcosine oxidase subunit alpha n=1 Tax=Granulicella aggregans TaxID=474949 RepID=A0A7W7ZDW1_9BACT|nr:(2Fe-2S)-binding protein [Granulicella aggregans]MBB5057943.1 sarcosine oxidase subunit alpha [Granulicella aggregans]
MLRNISSPARVTVWLNGTSIEVPEGTMASAVFLVFGVPCRASVTGEQRTALCGMGICFECRATVDGAPHRRTCQLPCREGMRLETQP